MSIKKRHFYLYLWHINVAFVDFMGSVDISIITVIELLYGFVLLENRLFLLEESKPATQICEWKCSSYSGFLKLMSVLTDIESAGYHF